MSPIRAASLYQETRLNLDAALPGSTIDLLIPANNASAFASRSSPKRRRLDQPEVKYDEETFSRLHLASESSIYFRAHTKGTKHHQSPRAILWRILEDRKVLELQAVDLSQDHAQKDEALLTIRFAFPTAIRPCGVVFAEEDQHDENDTAHRNFVSYVVTTSGELFTLRLGRGAFVKSSGQGSLEKDGAEWCTSVTSSAFTFRTPYRLLARSARELWASLSDGSLVRFQRETSSDQKWRETFFMEGGWKATVRGLIVWKPQNNVRYEDADLHPTTACSLLESPDGKHIWTVSLDHTLRAWSIETGKIVFVSDLANDMSRDLQKPFHSLLDPARSQLLQICPGRREGEYSVVTFSPNSREFKFWHVKDAEVAQYGADDILPDFKFVPPMEELIDANIWTLENFHAKPPQSSHSHQWNLWILIRSGAKCHTFQIVINLDDHIDKLSRSWSQNWAKTHPGSSTGRSLAVPDDGEADEVWQDFLFYPGRFTAPTLETALAVYWNSLSRGLQSKKQSIIHSKRPLCDQISETMELPITLARGVDDTVAYGRHERDLAAQWHIFYGAVKDLHKRREEVLSMAYDADQDLAWVIMADQVSPIRASSEVEVLLSNKDAFANAVDLHADNILLQALEDSRNAEIAQVVNAAGIFKQSFSRTSLTNLRSLLVNEAMQELQGAGSDLLDKVYHKSSIATQVTDDDYNQLTFALTPLGGFAQLDDNIFTSALALLVESQKGHHQRQQLTHYGARFLIRGAQETLQTSLDMVFSLLVLVLFIGGELEEDDLPEALDTHNLFVTLLQKLKELELLSWMAGTLRPERSRVPPSSTKPTLSESKELATIDHNTEKPAAKPLTVSESIFIGDWASMMFPTGPEAVLLTYWCRAWTFGARLSDQYDNIACHIMGSLLKSNDIDLANDFLKFLPQTRWANYLTARFHLASGDYAEAARYFKAAAEELAKGKYMDIEQVDSANILDLEERNYFNEGLPAYYQHIVSLFEKAGLLSYVADFAQLGLDAQKDEAQADPNVKSELLSRLFNAALQASRYETACTALQQFTDQALLKSSLSQLLKSLLSSPSGSSLLLTLPIPAPHLVDAYLSSLATATTTSCTASSTAFAASTSLLTSHTAPRPSTRATSNPNKLLYSYRLQRNDLRGAATALWDRLQLLRAVRDGEVSGSIGFGIGGNQELDGEIKECYLSLLNLLGLMDAEEAWILTRPLVGVGGEPQAKRRVLTLSDVRRAWQEELDGRADYSAGRVPLFGRVGAKSKGKGASMRINGNAGLGAQQNGQAMGIDVFA